VAAASLHDGFSALIHVTQSITGPGNDCKKVTNESPTGLSAYVPTSTLAEWQSFGDHPPTGVTIGDCSQAITVPCAPNVDLYALANKPATGGAYTFVIPAGCTVGSNTTALPALSTGSWPAGTSLSLTNHGVIEGKEGAGGAGGIGNVTNFGQPGGRGGDAIGVATDIAIDNSAGIIRPGGGGGGGGGTGGFNTSGGAGGAGQGFGNETGPAPGASGGDNSYCVFGVGYVEPGDNPLNYCNSGNIMYVLPGSGGSGGAWGMPGNTGGSGGSGQGYVPFYPFYGGSGGQPGNAVSLYGRAVSWLGGSDAAHVIGGTTVGPATACSDGIDNDGNGLSDSADSCACASPIDILEKQDKHLCMSVVTQCSDGIDNNGNGVADGADSCSCSSIYDESEAFDTNLCSQCSDGIDNDASGAADMADTCACSASNDNDESYDINLCPITITSTIICTELHRQGLMPDSWMQADQDFGHKMPAIVMNGYHAWARPVVSLMQRSHAFTMFVYAFAHPWAQEMAYLQGVEDHGSFLGILVMVVGVPFSALVGIFVTPWW
jgi:hypothetical protein